MYDFIESITVLKNNDLKEICIEGLETLKHTVTNFEIRKALKWKKKLN